MAVMGGRVLVVVCASVHVMPVGEEVCAHSINSTTQARHTHRHRHTHAHTYAARVQCNNETVSQFDEVPVNSDTTAAGIAGVIDSD